MRPLAPMIDLRAVYKDWPKATQLQARECEQGGRDCPRCRAMIALGVDPYTLPSR